METKEHFYSVNAAAMQLGVCRTTLATWIKTGKIITSYCIGDRPLFTSTELEKLERYIAENPPKVGRPLGWRKLKAGDHEHESAITQ